MSILTRIPELACPLCKGELEEGDGLVCSRCGKRYEIRGGIPWLIDDADRSFAEEIAVQDRVAGEYEEKRYRNDYSREYHDWWTDLMLADVNRSGRILDNGCGIGLLFDRDFSERVVGIDISSEMLQRAATKSDQLALGNSQQLPLRDGSFDLVVCRSLLHHLPDPAGAVEEICRVLRPGGEVVLADTHRSLISTLPRRAAQKGERFAGEHKNLTRRMITGWLTPHFEVKRVTYFGYIAYPLLGFPDLCNFFEYIPLKSLVGPVLMTLDRALSRIPIIRTLSWGIIIRGVKPSCEASAVEEMGR